jgi:hypothetical protein
MSRYELEPLNPDHYVAIGWDSPLSNYYLLVLDKSRAAEDPEHPVVGLGADGYGTQPYVDPVLDTARKYGHVYPGLRNQLLADREKEPARPGPGRHFIDEMQKLKDIDREP